MSRWHVAALAVLASGFVSATGVSISFEMSVWHALRIVGVTVATSAAVALVGAVGLRASRRGSMATQTTIVVLTGLGAVAAGVMVASSAMFIHDDDVHVLLVIVLSSLSCAVAVALAFGARVSAAAVAVGSVAQSIGAGLLAPAVPADVPRELALVSKELATMATRLGEARERERALETSRRELVAWVSHDLRTPLAGIRAMAEALEDGVVDDPAGVRRYHGGIRREADRLAEMVDDLFELSRIQAGQLRLQLQHVSLGDLVSDALASADPLASAKGVRLRGAVAGAPQVAVAVPEVSRVLRNLLHNAIRHTPSDGTIDVESGADAQWAYVAVRDACGGIPDHDLDRVFDVAFRGQAARTPAGDGGAGLGLAIARGIVEAHAGAISVENDGPGCRFVVRLPLAAV